MNRCIGFPYCDNECSDDNMICTQCWRRLTRTTKGSKLRSEYLAANRKFKGTRLCNDAKALLEKHLHDSLFVDRKRKVSLAEFTVVKR